MEKQPRKVRIVMAKPHRVVVRFLETGKEVQLSKSAFKKRAEAGLFEIVNPDAMPAVL